MMGKIKYSKLTGLGKSIKNNFICLGIPALVLLVDRWTEWVPIEYHSIAYPIIGVIAYYIKNWKNNK